MKSIFLAACAAAAFACTVNAQITIQASDFPSLGAIATHHIDTSVINSVPGTAGASQTWNFGQANSHFTEQFHVVELPAEWGGDFPSATQAILLVGSNDYSVYSLQNNGYRFHGTYAQDTAVLTSLPLLQYPFPLSFNDNFSDSANSVSEYGIPAAIIRTKTKTKLHKQVDGWGTLTTPMGTFQALRVKETTITHDSVFSILEGSPIPTFNLEEHDTSVKYIWLGKDRLFPLADYLVDIQRFGFYEVINLSVNEVGATALPEPYPNPVNAGTPVVFSPGAGNFTLRLFDAAGRQLSAKKLDTPTYSMPTYGLPAGTYRYTLVPEKNGRPYAGSIIIK